MENKNTYIDKVKDASGKFRFRIKNESGGVLMRSEAYDSEKKREAAIQSFRILGTDRKNFHVREAANGKYYFRLINPSTKALLATSETYASYEELENALATIQRISQQLSAKIKMQAITKKSKSDATEVPKFPKAISISINPGSAPPEEIANLLAQFSILYRKFGGSGLSFTLEGIEESTQIELA